MKRLVAILMVISIDGFGQMTTPSSIDSVQLFGPGVVSCGDYESHPALSPDGRVLFFIKCTADINSSCTIYYSLLQKNSWTKPQVATFSGQYYDIDPFVSADGRTVYFASNRPTHQGGQPKTDTDLWRVTRIGEGWGEPEHLRDVNSPAEEYYPTLSDKGTLYFGSTRGGRGGSDIFRSRWINEAYESPVNIGDSVNTANHEYEPFISPDESYLLFMATREGGLQTADLYVSYARGNGWSRPARLPEPINSAYTEWSPKVTRDSKFLLFSSTRSRTSVPSSKRTDKQILELLHSPGNGLGDIYFVPLGSLLRQK